MLWVGRVELATAFSAEETGSAFSVTAATAPGSFKIVQGAELVGSWRPPDGWEKFVVGSACNGSRARPVRARQSRSGHARTCSLRPEAGRVYITRHSGAVLVAGHLSNSITSARPSWQRIRHGTKQGSKHQSAGCGRARSGVFRLLSPEWPELATAHIPNLREECASWLSAHAGWLAICADCSLREVRRFAWWRISGARPSGEQAFSRARCLVRTSDEVRTSDAVLGDQRGER